MDHTQFEILALIINCLSVLSSLTIAIIVFLASKKIDSQNYTYAVKSAWMTLDSTILADEALLIQADYLLHPEKRDEPIELKKRRWICYLYLNTLSTVYNGIENNLISNPQAARDSLIKTLQGLVRNPEFMEMTEYFYVESLRKLCLEVYENCNTKDQR